MNINNISNQTFEGNVIFSEKLTKPMIEYSNKILDYSYLDFLEDNFEWLYAKYGKELFDQIYEIK